MTDKHSTLSGHETGDGRQLGPGTRLRQFELREPLGTGAMGQANKKAFPFSKSATSTVVAAWLEIHRVRPEDDESFGYSSISFWINPIRHPSDD